MSAGSSITISLTSAIFAGLIDNTGGESANTTGIEYGLTTGYGQTLSQSGAFNRGNFYLKADALSCDTAYQFRAFATNTAGTIYSNNSSFTTSSCSRILYGTDGGLNNTGTDTQGPQLYALNPETGSKISTIGPVGYYVNGMSFNTTNGILYAATGDTIGVFTGNINFTSLNQVAPFSAWEGIAAAPNGNVYAAESGGDIYMQTSGVGDFLPLHQTNRGWWGMTAAPNGNIYATVDFGDIYMQTNGTGDFLPLNQTHNGWVGLAAAPNGNVYAVDQGNIYMQTGGVGDFNNTGETARSWFAIAAAPNGDIYAADQGGDIYKQTAGVGNFLALGVTHRSWYSLVVAANGDIYAGTTIGDIYIRRGGTGDFVSMAQGNKSWEGLTVAPNGNVYAADSNGGSIYMQNNVSGTPSPSPHTHSLITINTSTGGGTYIGAITDLGAAPINLEDISFRSDGRLYGWSAGDNDLYTVDLTSCNGIDTTCLATKVGESSLTTAGDGMTFYSVNNLAVFGNHDFSYYKVNPDTGLVISNPGLINSSGSGYTITAATLSGENAIFATLLNNVNAPSNLLVMNPTENSIIFSTGNNSDLKYISALAFTPTSSPVPPVIPVVPIPVIISRNYGHPLDESLSVLISVPIAIPHNYIFGTALIKFGSRGDFCKAWQIFFNDKMGSHLVLDGICGKLTMTVARSWQASVGLKADGLLGPMSRAKALTR